MSPYHPAQKSDGHHRVDDYFCAQERLTQAIGEHVRDDPYCRQNRDVHFRVTKEPEQVLPQEGRTTSVILQTIAHHKPRRDEEARAGHPIEQQKQAGGQQDGKRQQSDRGSNEPRPRGYGHAHQSHALGT